MRPELCSRLETYDIEGLTRDDKKELLDEFIRTGDHAVRHQTVLMLSELGYDEAVPFIFQKIFDKALYNRNGTLVWALENLNAGSYFLDFIRIICDMEYEPTLWAMESIKKYAPSIDTNVRHQALEMLEQKAEKIGKTDDEHYNNSPLHFIEETMDILNRYS